ncbi:MAG: O-antigen ligase family protein [Actinomycetaceae bacterium]
MSSAADRVSDERPRIGAVVGLVALVLVAGESVADVLPDDPLVWLVTPLRLVVAIGLAGVSTAVPPNRWRTLADPGIALLLAGATLAALQHGGWPLWRWLLTYVAVYYLAVAVRRAGALRWRVLSPLALLAVTPAAVVALGQRANGTATGFCRDGLAATTVDCADPAAIVRVVGTLPNPNLLAAFLLLLLPLAVGAAAHPPGAGPVARLLDREPGRLVPDRAWATVVLAIVAAGYLAVWQTMSRAGIAAGAASLLVLVTLGWRPARRPRVLAGVAAAAAAGTVVLALTGFPLGVRAEVWRASASLVAADPLGVGLGRGGPLVTDAVPGDEQIAHAHNLWLHWLLEGGVLALLGVLAVCVAVGVVLARADRRGSLSAAPLTAATAGFAVLCLVDHPTGAASLALLTAVVVGCATTADTDRDIDAVGPPSSAAGRPYRPRAARQHAR